jgi:tRNA (guanine37-N1)-methyltransferase
MKIDILTLFPEFFSTPLNTSIIKRAKEFNKVEINVIDIRDFTTDKHKKADDRPFGGGCGMVMKPEPIFSAIESLEKKENSRVIFTCPTGKQYNQKKAEELSKLEHIIILCGHYEGVDQRIRDHIIDEEISVGDYVLTGGEIPSLLIIDSVVRLLDGVLGNSDSAEQDSFSDGLLDHPHYTRPSNFRGFEVPEVLISGDHAKIDDWRLEQRLKLTLSKRPDLIKTEFFDKKTTKIFNKIKKETQQ